jgi:predicted RNA binding protein YcfA (HicA-like mRNA interferase family)
MSRWSSTKAREVYKALIKIGWYLKREAKGSHRILAREGWQDFVFSFHDNVEIGPHMLTRIAKKNRVEAGRSLNSRRVLL